MYKLLSYYKSKQIFQIHTILLLIFLLLLGSHLLDYHLYVFIIFALFLVDWRYLSIKNSFLVTFFIISIYVTWIFLDPRLLHHFNLGLGVFSHGILILLMYFLGLSIDIKQKNGMIISDKKIFYLFFIFVISYSLLVFWSYITITQDNPLTSAGMFVCFPNPYQLAHINGGRLISTILTYYLTLMTFTLPLIIFYFHTLKKQGFYTLELILLVALSLFVLYISAMMGRRTLFVLFALICLFLFTMWLKKYRPNNIQYKKLFFFPLILGMLFYGTYILNQQSKNSIELDGLIATPDCIIPIIKSPKKTIDTIDIPIVQRLMTRGLKDHRFEWWPTALNVMMKYPFGGGNGVYIAPGMKLAHNTWIDMGKDLGVLPFILFLSIALLHIYYLFRIFFSKNIESLLKYQLTIIAIGVFAIMMIEPVFNSDKTFFAYIFFYFGMLYKFYFEAHKNTLLQKPLN